MKCKWQVLRSLCAALALIGPVWATGEAAACGCSGKATVSQSLGHADAVLRVNVSNVTDGGSQTLVSAPCIIGSPTLNSVGY